VKTEKFPCAGWLNLAENFSVRRARLFLRWCYDEGERKSERGVFKMYKRWSKI